MSSDGALKLVRPTFTGDSCGGKPGPCGSGCWCFGPDKSKCVGCTCGYNDQAGGFQCGSAAPPPGVPCPSSVPAGFTCFKDGPSFATALNAPAKVGDKLALVCPAASPCTISGTQLGGTSGVAATAIMENVLVQNNKAQNGGLLNIGSGSVTGTKLTFRNGTGSVSGGGVYMHSFGTFACTDCVFDKCASGNGGGVWTRDGTLQLVRPTFTADTCSDSGTCASACACHNDASRCVGCLCEQCAGVASKCAGGSEFFYCDSTPADALKMIKTADGDA